MDYFLHVLRCLSFIYIYISCTVFFFIFLSIEIFCDFFFKYITAMKREEIMLEAALAMEHTERNIHLLPLQTNVDVPKERNTVTPRKLKIAPRHCSRPYF